MGGNNWQLIFIKGENQGEIISRSGLRPLNLIEEISDKVGALVTESSVPGEWILIYSFPRREASYYQKKFIPSEHPADPSLSYAISAD